MLQCVAVRYSALQWLQKVTVYCSALQCVAVNFVAAVIEVQVSSRGHFAMCCSVLQCVAVCCSVLQCAAVYCSVFSVLQCVAVCCNVLQCAAVFCSVLQCVADYLRQNFVGAVTEVQVLGGSDFVMFVLIAVGIGARAQKFEEHA